MGPAQLDIERIEDDGVFTEQLAVAFEAAYSGAAGIGTAAGEVNCSLPDGGEPLLDTEP